MTKRCILDGKVKSPCTPSSDIHVALHGTSGKGGRIGAANIPSSYRTVTIENSPVREDQAKAYDTFDKYTKTFERQHEGLADIKSLYLYSPNPGNGKTTSAIALANAYLLENFIGSIKRKRTPSQRPVYFLDITEWLSDYNQFNRSMVPQDIAEPASKRYYHAMKKAMHTPFVVLDDIGTREYTEAFRADLHTVINYRVTEGLPTIYTSNLPIKSETTSDLGKLFGEPRLADRISDQCLTVVFKGQSKRGIR